jgi:hypothetical protein
LQANNLNITGNLVVGGTVKIGGITLSDIDKKGSYLVLISLMLLVAVHNKIVGLLITVEIFNKLKNYSKLLSSKSN